jgi:hypothetical protein
MARLSRIRAVLVALWIAGIISPFALYWLATEGLTGIGPNVVLETQDGHFYTRGRGTYILRQIPECVYREALFWRRLTLWPLAVGFVAGLGAVVLTMVKYVRTHRRSG